jgi:hypothetical protein
VQKVSKATSLKLQSTGGGEAGRIFPRSMRDRVFAFRGGDDIVKNVEIHSNDMLMCI